MYIHHEYCLLLNLDLYFLYYRGKMKRIALQFTPYSWTDFDWRPLSSLRRWLCMLGVIAIVSKRSLCIPNTDIKSSIEFV